jgi:hypothetical protein
VQSFCRPSLLTWHDRPLREVTIEKLVVDGDVLVPHRVLAVLDLDDAVDQKEWVSTTISMLCSAMANSS